MSKKRNNNFELEDAKLQKIQMDKEIELDMHRMYMEREDKMSLEHNNYVHRMKFKEKDMNPPDLPF